jgi:hypothetical protein
VHKQLAWYLSIDGNVGGNKTGIHPAQNTSFEDHETMNLSTRTMVYPVVMAFSLAGCAFWHSGLPEHVFTTPLQNGYMTSRVAIFKFREPPYARGMGRAASESLYEALLRNNVFQCVTLEVGVSDTRPESLISLARNKHYDLMITGDLLYYFEGSLHEPSRVDGRIRVIHVHTNKTLWYAKAVDLGPPAPYTDYILFERPGTHAPTAMGLLNRNAEKFTKMLLNAPPQEFSSIMP